MLVENNFTTYLMVNILAAMYLLADKVFNEPINHFWNRNADSVSKEQQKKLASIFKMIFHWKLRKNSCFLAVFCEQVQCPNIQYFWSVFSRIWTN